MNKNSCDYIFETGRKAGARCEIIPKDNNRHCSKHKRVMANKCSRALLSNALESDPVFSKILKMRFSNYAITVNFNQNYEKLSPERKSLYKDFAEFVFSEQGIKRFLTDTCGEDLDCINKLTINKYFEIGPKNGFLHMHGLLMIEHTGNIRLELNRIRALGRKVLGHVIHVDAPVSGDSAKAFEQYMMKSKKSFKF